MSAVIVGNYSAVFGFSRKTFSPCQATSSKGGPRVITRNDYYRPQAEPMSLQDFILMLAVAGYVIAAVHLAVVIAERMQL